MSQGDYQMNMGYPGPLQPRMGRPLMSGPMSGSTGQQTEVYAGDLPIDITENELYNLFSYYGKNCHVTIYKRENRNSSYARVKYDSWPSAKLAVDNLNYKEVHGRQIIVALFQPGIALSTGSNVFIKNIEKSMTNKDLHELFRQYGDILSAKVCCDDEGNSKGFGFILFADKPAAETAIEKGNNTDYKGKCIAVAKFLRKTERPRTETKFNNLYIKNLPNEDYSKDDVIKLFEEFGEILSVVVVKSSFKTEEGEKQGAFSFVCFKEAMDAMKALEAMNGAEVEGAVLFVTKAQRKKEREAEKLRRKQDRKRASQNCTVYIKNFKPESVSEENVRAVFSEVEGLKSVFIPTYKQMNSQGELVTMRKPFGFITYENPSQVEEAVTKFNNKNLLDAEPQQLFVAKLERREKRRSRMQKIRSERSAPLGMNPFFPGFPVMDEMGPNFHMGMGMMGPRQNRPPRYNRGNTRGRGMMNPGYNRGDMGRGQRGHRGPRPHTMGMGGGMHGHMQGAVPMGPPHGPMTYPPRGHPDVGHIMPPNMMPPMQNVPPMGGVMMPVSPQDNFGGGQPMYNPQFPPHSHPPQIHNQIPLPADFDQKSDDDKKQEIGELIFGIANEKYPDDAAKVTGMLLELDVDELYKMLQNQAMLESKIEEAAKILIEHRIASINTGFD